MTVSERIFKIMDERGMSQIEFSRATGITQSTISDWKRKKTNPASDKIMTICKILNVTPYEVLQDTPNGKHAVGIPKDCVVVSKDTRAYELLGSLDKLDDKQFERLMGYLTALMV